MSYCVPSDTAQVLTSRLINDCKNFGLLIQRLATYEAVMNVTDKKGASPRYSWLEVRCKEFEPDEKLISASAKRWYQLTQGAERFAMTTQSRLVVGLGGKGAMEFGLTLHRVTGLPYIPGSALKGVCRNYMLLTIAGRQGTEIMPDLVEKLDANLCAGTLDESDPDASLYRRAFGTQAVAGEAIFYDAVMLPQNSSPKLFSVDVMTPHFGPYYQGKGRTSPSDDMKPVPVFFPTVNEGIQFGFAVGIRQGSTMSPDDVTDIATKLKEAVETLGVGAKTAAGYGVLEESFLDRRLLKDGYEIGDEVSGRVFDASGDLWFSPDGEEEVEARIPRDRILKQRKEDDVVKGRIVAIVPGNPLQLVCDQVDTSKK